MLERIALVLTVAMGGCQKAEDPIEPMPPTAADVAAYHAAADGLLASHVHGGFGVVSLKPDGSPEHLGEALIWGGTALWALPCDKGAPLAASLARMVLEGNGALVRVQPLGEYADGRQITMDGALGAFLGISRRVIDCGEAELWREPLRLMTAFQEGNGGRMHPGSSARLIGEFAAVRDRLAFLAGAGSNPDSRRYQELYKTAGGWAAAVLVAHETGVGADACFRVNLGMTAYLALETTGLRVSQAGRDQFCAATKTMDIPTVDHWCGRQSIVEYLQTYEPNAWEYRHQRCGGGWESPDGDGNTSPGLDRLVAMVMAFDWPALQ